MLVYIAFTDNEVTAAPLSDGDTSAFLHAQIDIVVESLRRLASTRSPDTESSPKRKRETESIEIPSAPKRQRITELLEPLTEPTRERSLLDLINERRRLREAQFKEEMMRRRATSRHSGPGLTKLVAAAVVGGIATWSALAYL